MLQPAFVGVDEALGMRLLLTRALDSRPPTATEAVGRRRHRDSDVGGVKGIAAMLARLFFRMVGTMGIFELPTRATSATRGESDVRAGFNATSILGILLIPRLSSFGFFFFPLIFFSPAAAGASSSSASFVTTAPTAPSVADVPWWFGILSI